MKTYSLKLTAAVVFDGNVVRAGKTIQADVVLAKNLLARGKAELSSGERIDATQEYGDIGQGTRDTGDGDGEGEGQTVDFSKLNKAELVAVAGELGIEGADKLNKAQLVEAIEAASQE